MASRFINFLHPIRKYSLSKVQARYHSSFRDKLKSFPETKITTLDNGVRVATETTTKPIATVGIFIENGSRYENDNNNGASKFLEHLMFSGNSKKNATKFESELESMGVHLNAQTGREEQSLYATCVASDVPKVIEILSEIISNKTYDDKEFEIARNDILESIEAIQYDPRKIIMEYLHKAAYQGTSLGFSTLGQAQIIKNITKKEVESYARDAFLANKIVLSASGGVSHDDLVSLANKQLGSLSNTYIGEFVNPKPCRFTACEIRDREDDIDYPHYLMTIEGLGWDNPDNLAMQIGQAMIGNWEHTQAGSLNVSNRLPAQCIEEEWNLKRMESFYFQYKGTGLWGSYLINEMLNMEFIMTMFQDEWMRVCKSVHPSEIQQAKELIMVNTFNKVFTTEGACKDIGRQVLRHNNRMSPAEFEAQLGEINESDVQEVLFEHIYDKSPVVIGFGPTQALLDYARIRSQMFQLRL